MCGEHLPSFLLPSFIAGSSPRVRGTPGGALVDLRMTGIIPACAGNTAWPWLRWLMFRDHPRVCGEHDSAVWFDNWPQGSSPRVRGTRMAMREWLDLYGIIPACAGNTYIGGESTECPRDHPRVCGNTKRTNISSCVNWDHPRVCGEHRLPKARAQPASGSSPRVRGTHLVAQAFNGGFGIIPACAGNTNALRRNCFPEGDHPRVCGEHFHDPYTGRTMRGSSPRVRGTRSEVRALRLALGIIPACAGNT